MGEEEVAKALLDLETSSTSELKNDVRDILISTVKEVDVKQGSKATVIFVPFRAWKAVKKVQGRLIREMEKKLSKRHVVFTAQRTILDKTFRRKGLKIRPRSRTLTAVHEDICGPSEIVAKRTRCRIDGSKLLKVFLDSKDKDKDNVEEKLQTFAVVYNKLTNKDVSFEFQD